MFCRLCILWRRCFDAHFYAKLTAFFCFFLVCRIVCGSTFLLHSISFSRPPSRKKKKQKAQNRGATTTGTFASPWRWWFLLNSTNFWHVYASHICMLNKLSIVPLLLLFLGGFPLNFSSYSCRLPEFTGLGEPVFCCLMRRVGLFSFADFQLGGLNNWICCSF